VGVPGGRCPSPVGDIACDILHHKATDRLFDVFVAAGAEARVSPFEVNHHRNPDRPWVAPVDPSGGTVPPPPPPDCSTCLTEVASVRAQLSERDRKIGELNGKVTELESALTNSLFERDEARKERDAARQEAEQLKNRPQPSAKWDWGSLKCVIKK
jgi:outer membrane murein-binding lipoprotein Lpp